MRRSTGARLAVGALALLSLGGTVGCGGDEGAAKGSTVTVYVASSLCGAARAEVARAGGRAGDLRVRVFCLAPAEGPDGTDPARAGENARRATEDSTAVAFLEAPGQAGRFTRPLVEAAELAWIEAKSATPMKPILKAIGEADTSSPRESVREQLG